MRHYLPMALLLLLAACAPQSVSRYHRLPSEGWRYGREMRYALELADTVQRGTVVVAAQTDGTCPYAEVYVELMSGPREAMRRDTLCLRLADAQGASLGTGIGAERQVADTLPHPLTIKSLQPLRLRHVMRCDTLRGLSQLGIFFIPE